MFLLGIICAVLAGAEMIRMQSEQRKFETIAQSASQPASAPPIVSEPTPSAKEVEPQKETENTKEAAPEPEILPKYKELWMRNPELYGWIKIDDTVIDYPVMYTPNDPQKYLHLDFDGASSTSGTIFLDARCSSESDNSILYGHNMKNQTMFGSILNYKDASYWKAHPVIHFDTLFEEREYEVLAAFFDRVYNTSDTCFKYYNFIKAANETTFNEAVQYYKKNALYDTGVSAQYGDLLLTLSTCAYHTENGRFVVVAKLKK